MSRKCELTGKIPLAGHKVSHANNKVKRRFLPNLKKITFTSELLNKNIKLNVSNSARRDLYVYLWKALESKILILICL